ncbi:FAD-dependent oxidoreductase [Orrella daihaiensis]|uniref:FAD-dependent oxidoreductase n=1 Tax=Orrella daihaiensis TaxID=2782176 RepID=A0ABY4AKW1_9BURK|nr:FAD-dependent oxidoreductase [Orrella daihaiensis]UOD50045.1 FAD-dependent oxidoreductase [Orrella daihaiensis]
MKKLVLVGAGHAHALVLNAWRQASNPGVELILVAPIIQAPYSGMIPGWLAGQYRFEETIVDFVGLCQRAGARLIKAELVKLDPDTKTIELSGGRSLTYDWLSINVGSTLRPPEIDANDVTMLAMRPLSTLQSRYESWLTAWQAHADSSPLHVTAVGGGAAGVESILCVKHRLKQLRPDRPVRAQLITRSTTILPGFSPCARRLALKTLQRADITVQLGTDWHQARGQSGGLIIWATGAQAHDWQNDPISRGSLHTDSSDFIVVDEHLRSVSHPNVFAVGDCAALPIPLPKAGVYAVRMGTTLSNNLKAVIHGHALSPFKRRGMALALLNTANGRAIASWGPLGWQGNWVMRWKDRIDRGFIERLTCGI